MMNIDWKRNNKIAIRNFTEGCDLHDIVKIMLVRLLRRRNKGVPIYTEYDPHKPQEDYPDVWMQIGKDIYVWEIQKDVSREWTTQIVKRYEDVNLVVIPLKDVELRLQQAIKRGGDWLVELRHIISIYVV